MRLEKELYGELDDPLKQHTGINFEKYEDIPVEATGAGVPDPVTAFASPPLDPTLLENINYARYTTPTPVQKYSIPIIAAGRDLLACAQVFIIFFFLSTSINCSCYIVYRQVLERLAAFCSLSYRHHLSPALAPIPMMVPAITKRHTPPLSSWHPLVSL